MYSIKMYPWLFLVFARSGLHQAGCMCHGVIYSVNTIYCQGINQNFLQEIKKASEQTKPVQRRQVLLSAW